MGAMAERKVQVWMLMRGVDEKASLFFPQVIVTAQEDEPALFSAYVAGFESRMVAMGHSAEEASQNAIELFRNVVDHALDQHQPLTDVIGKTFFARLEIPIERGDEVFELWRKAGLKEEAEDDWRAVPTNPQFTQLAGATA